MSDTERGWGTRGSVLDATPAASRPAAHRVLLAAADKSRQASSVSCRASFCTQPDVAFFADGPVDHDRAGCISCFAQTACTHRSKRNSSWGSPCGRQSLEALSIMMLDAVSVPNGRQVL